MTSRSSGTAGFGLRAGVLVAVSGGTVPAGATPVGATPVAAGGAPSGFAGSVWQGALATSANCTAIAIAAARDRTRIRPLTNIVTFPELPGRLGLQQHLVVLGVYPELHGLTIRFPLN